MLLLLLRIIIISFIICLALISVKKLYKIYNLWQQAIKKSTEPKNNEDQMVKCIFCGIFTPKKTAIKINSNYFCSTEHKEKFNNAE